MRILPKNREVLGIVLLVIWIIYSLAALLKTGFISDDAYNSQIKGRIIQDGITLGDRIFEEMAGWLLGSGRLMLSWAMTYSLYYYTQDPVTVKAIAVAVNTTVILLFYVFAKRETGSWRVALVACLLVPVCFQFRLWHDPILAFTLLMPITFALVMGALVLYQKYLDGSDRRFIVAAACVYVVAVLMYEIAVPLCVLFVVLAFARLRSVVGALINSLPFTGAAAMLMAVSAAFRLYLIKAGESTYPGAELHLDPHKLLTAFSVQTVASIPLSYFHFMQDRPALVLHRGDYAALVLFGLGLAALVYRIGREAVLPHWSNWLSWMGCAAMLLFLSAGLTSLSGHQDELIQAGFGFGYLPVYFQYFGLCMFVASLIWIVASRLRWPIALAIFSLLVGAGSATVAGVNLGLNRAVVAQSNQTYKYPRALLNAALKAGIASDMQEGAFLLRNMRFASDHTWALTLATGKTFDVCDPGDAAIIKGCLERMRPPHARLKAVASPDPKLAVTDAREGDVWTLSYNFDKKTGRTGRVLLGRVERVVTDSEGGAIAQLLVRDIRIYDLKLDQVRTLVLPAPVNFLHVIEEESEDMTEARPVASVLQPADDVDFQWLGRVYARDGNSANNLRWSSGDATLALHNFSGTPQTVAISMGLGIATAGTSTVVINYLDHAEKVAVKQVPVDYRKTLVLKPGRTEIRFSSDAPEIQNGDPRHIVFGVFNFKLMPVKQPG